MNQHSTRENYLDIIPRRTFGYSISVDPCPIQIHLRASYRLVTTTQHRLVLSNRSAQNFGDHAIKISIAWVLL